MHTKTNGKNQKWGQTRYEFIAENDPGEMKSVLSMGCSYGWELEPFYKTAEFVAGIDVNRTTLDQAKASYPNAKFDFCSVTEVPYPDETFDLVILSEVIEHVGDANKLKVIEEAHRVLKGGGTFILTAPHAGIFAWADTNDFKRRFKPLYRLFMKVTGYRPETALEVGHKHLTLSELKELFAGKFDIVRVRYCGLVEPFVGLAVLALQLLRLPSSRLSNFWAREGGVEVPPFFANNIRLVATKPIGSTEKKIIDYAIVS